MRTWEAHQAHRPVGRVRRRLAEMIEKALPGALVEPSDLQSNNPQFSRAEVDGCNWDCWAVNAQGHKVHFYSWVPMRELVKAGEVILRADGPFNYDVDIWEKSLRPTATAPVAGSASQESAPPVG